MTAPSRFLLYLSLWMLIPGASPAQGHSRPYPVSDFCNPLDIPLELAGTFGEIRSNHLHSGLDLRTNNKEGYKVFCVGNGYVSRIKVSAYGYGNAIYITHPNGYVSVYGHLKEYSPEITRYVKQKQYEKESFDVDLFLKSDEMKVRKGQVIALSGNTGGSESPHLHFEIRDAGTEEIINPQLFGYVIADNTAPVIKEIMLYPRYGGIVNGSTLPQKLSVEKTGSSYRINSRIAVSGTLGFGISCYDPGNNDNRNGIYSLELRVDQQLIIRERFDRFAFDQSRYVNALIDYAEKTKSNTVFQKSDVSPGNRLKVDELNESKGLYTCKDQREHEAEFLVKDFQGNTSVLKFTFTGTASQAAVPQVLKPRFTAIFPYDKPNSYQTSDFSISIPANALYDTLLFEYSKSETVAGSYSPIHHVHNKSVPLNSACTVSIKPLYLPEGLRDKALLCIADNKHYSSQGGSWSNGYVSTKTRSFGDFVVLTDTIAPEIKPLNIHPGADLSAESTIRIHIGDNLSGIKSYRATVDGKWLLMALDSKTSVLTYLFDEHVPPGEHTLELTLTDEKENSAVYRARFRR